MVKELDSAKEKEMKSACLTLKSNLRDFPVTILHQPRFIFVPQQTSFSSILYVAVLSFLPNGGGVIMFAYAWVYKFKFMMKNCDCRHPGV